MTDSHHTDHLDHGFQVGEYYVEPELQRVSGQDLDVRIEPKVMEVLLLLARQPGRTVPKDAFMDEVWSDTVVTQDALLRCISELRKLFRDDPQAPRYIETIRKRGYRLVAPVSVTSVSVAPDSIAPVSVTSVSVAAETPTDTSEAPFDAQGSVRSPASGRKWRVGLSLLAVAAAIAIGLAVWQSDRSATAPLNAIPVTSLLGVESDPNLSPDGSRIAFVWDGGSEGNFDIYVKQLGVETPLRLTTHGEEERSPAWSPDGQRIAYVRRGPAGNGLFIVPSLGGSSIQVADLGDRTVNAVAWSPDGRYLAYAVEVTPHGAYGIWLLSLEASETRQITQPPADFRGDYELAFSPDGSRLAFVRGVVDRVDDVYVVGISGGEARRLTFDHAEITGLDWRQDGRDIVFSSDREGAFTLWRVAATGGAPVWIPTAAVGTGVHQPSIARAGDGLAYIQRHQEINIWRFEWEADTLGTGEQHRSQLISSTRWDSNPDVSPRDGRIAFASNRSGSYEIWIADSDGSDPVQITHLDGPFANTPKWSPDGTSIAFAARGEGSVDIYVVSVTGGTPRRLTSAASNDQAPRWSSDEAHVYFGSNRIGAARGRSGAFLQRAVRPFRSRRGAAMRRRSRATAPPSIS